MNARTDTTRTRIVVVGDTLLDVDVTGTSERLSPDAPVPVLDVQDEVRRAGGAGLVATMLARDGHDVTLVTVLGQDDRGAELRDGMPGVRVVAGDSGVATPSRPACVSATTRSSASTRPARRRPCRM